MVEALEHNGDTEYDAYLRNYLDIYIKSISDLDFVAVCEKDSTCRYYPNRAFVGRILTFGGENRVLSRRRPLSGDGGTERIRSGDGLRACPKPAGAASGICYAVGVPAFHLRG